MTSIPAEAPKASRYALALTLATIIAGPISGLLIGVSIGQTHFSRSTPQLFAWGRNFALALSLLLLAFNLQYTFILAVIERHGFMRAFGKPKIAQIIWPVLTASTEMVAQFYFTEKIRKVTKSLVWTTIPRLLGAFSFAVACTRTILIATRTRDAVGEDHTKPFKLPTYLIGRTVILAWAGTALLAQLSILAAHLFSSNYRDQYRLNHIYSQNFLKHFMIIIINTSLLHTMLLLTIVTMLIINITTNEQPEPTVVCFIMAMNILRPSVAYFNLATAMARENCKSYESYPSSIIYGNSESQNKIHKAETAGNVMVHTVRSQFVEA